MNKGLISGALKLLAFAVALSIFSTQVSKSFAQIPSKNTSETVQNPAASSTQPVPPQYNLNTNPDVPHNLNTYTQSTFIEILSTASCFLTGADPINPHAKCLGVDQKTGKLGYVESQGGLTSVMGGLIAQTFVIPVSTSNYTQYLASSFGISENSYAQIPTPGGGRTGETEENQQIGNQGPPGSTPAGQGVGFVGLSPLIPIWLVFRNLAYLVFVLVFILLGLGIMFRLNIDARTVMTIQNQIPKIIVALVLITFSYAIAGFLIDLMYVVTYLVINLFQSQGLTAITNVNTNPLNLAGNLSGGISSIASPPAESVGDVISSLFSGKIGTLIGTALGAIMGTFLGSALPIPVVGSALVGVVGAGIGAFGGDYIIQHGASLIAYLVIIIAILSALFRTWIMLIKAYVYILIDVIFAPFWIIIGLLPLGSGGFGPWIRSLIANLAVFPVVVVIFMVGKTIIENLEPGRGNFIPPLIGNPGEESVSSIASFIGLGLILILPEALNLTKSTLKAPDFKITSAAGRAIGAGQKFYGGPVGGVWGKLTGENARGEARPLTRAVHNRFGAAAASVFGASFKRESFTDTEGAARRGRWFGRAEKIKEATPPTPPSGTSSPPPAGTGSPGETTEGGTSGTGESSTGGTETTS